MSRLHGVVEALPGRHTLAQGRHRHRTGDFAALVAAHTVGHRPETQFRGAEQRIFVVFAHAAGNRLRGVSQQLGHGFLLQSSGIPA
ncbi:hypothetical protein D9M71_224550 [compost metagenome]